MHGGFVGPGMLDAACAGEVFTSPVPDQMLAATKAVDGGAGVLHIVKNYTGDVMNFEMAAELAAAEPASRSRPWSSTTTSRCRTACSPPGAAASALTVLLEKIAGPRPSRAAASARSRTSRARSTAGRSMGMALTSCTVPAAGKPTFDLAEGEMEIGIGIHGEPGRRGCPLAPAREVAEMLLDPILADLDFTGGGGVIAFVNGMGATPLLELYLMYNEVAGILERAG